jgi:phosphate:Na+ symporter
MAAMGSAMAPLRTHEGFAQLLQSLQNPVLGMLAGAVFTALVQSSSATIGLSVVMATQGLLSLPAGIAILFGAKIGTGITAILAAIGKPRDAKRAAAVHVLFNVLGAVIWLPFIAQLAGLAEMISPVAAHLDGVERLAEEVPRQIANAATIWATANTLIFLPFAGLFATMAIRIIPDRAVEEKAIIRPRYLDDELIQVPSMALERARMELGHMAELAGGMLANVRLALESRDISELSQQHDQIVALREAVLGYLQHVGRAEFSDAEADEHARLVAATGEIENMSAAISHELAPLALTLKEANTTPSKETTELLERLFQTIQASAHSALRALVEQDEQAAQAVVASRDAILELTSEFHRQQAVRLAQDDPDRLLKFRVQLELLDRMRRLYSVAEHMAISVLPRSVLAGELSA